MESLIVISIQIILLIALVVRYVTRYAPENLVYISLLSACLGIYIPFVKYDMYMPWYLQALELSFGFYLPIIISFLQYNNIVISRKILYYAMKIKYSNKEYNTVINYINKLVNLEGRKAEYMYLLGKSYKMLGDFLNARDSFYLAIELDKSDYKSYYELGIILDETNRKEEAKKMFREAIKRKRNYYDAHEALGICYTSQGKFEEAIKIYNEALKIFPNSYEMYYNVAMLENQIGNNDEAIKAFESACNLNDKLYSAYFNLANLYTLEKEYDKAIEAYKKILVSSIYGKKAYYNISLLYAAKSEYEIAMSFLEYAMELDNSYIEEAKCEDAFKPIMELIKRYEESKELEKKIEKQKKNLLSPRIKMFKTKQDENIENLIENNKNIVNG